MIYIVGYGAMAEAIVQGLLQKDKEVAVVGRDERKLKNFSTKYRIPAYSLDGFDITDKEILLAVKPYALKEVAKKLRGRAKTLYSILAGVSLQELHIIEATHYVRVMPNIAAAKLASMTALTGDREVQEKALELFEAIGETIWLENETKLDIATAIAGSGPAFLALVAEAIGDGGVACGLSREEAMFLTKGLFKSSAAIMEDNHPALIKDQVMSPAGTTAAGYGVLEERAVRSAFIQAIQEAYKRAQNAR